MTPLRLHNNDSWIFTGGLTGITAMLSVLFLIVRTPLSWQVWAIAIALPLIVFVFGTFVFKRVSDPAWVEIGDRFTYANSTGVHNVDWKDVQSLELSFNTGEDAYITDVTITIYQETKLRLTITENNIQYNDRIIQSLVDTLRSSDPYARRFAAKSLGPLANQSDRVLFEAVLALREATNDNDEVVKSVATHALRRLDAGLDGDDDAPDYNDESIFVDVAPISIEVAPIRDGFVRVAFSGTAGDGSEGNVHGGQMHDAIRTVVNRDNPRGILIDVRNLTYRWGNYIEPAFSGGYHSRLPRRTPFPLNRMCVLASGETLNCLRSLWDLCGLHEELPLTDDETEAIEYITRDHA